MCAGTFRCGDQVGPVVGCKNTVSEVLLSRWCRSVSGTFERDTDTEGHIRIACGGHVLLQ